MSHNGPSRSNAHWPCDRCQRYKRVCSFKQPCQNCIATNEICIYSWRLNIHPTLGLWSEDFPGDILDICIDELASDELPLASPARLFDGLPDVTFAFLINSTTASGFASTFDNEFTFHKRQEIHHQTYRESSALNWGYHGGNFMAQAPSSGSFQLLESFEQRLLRTKHTFGYPTSTIKDPTGLIMPNIHVPPVDLIFTEHWMPQQYYRPIDFGLDRTRSTACGLRWNHDSLTQKSLEIVSRIKEAAILKPRNSTIAFQWSAAVEDACLSFFCPLNLRKFVDMYWISWYPHWPVIHKPTFSASATPCPLLATMVLIGASYSPEVTDRDSCRAWFNVVEEMVFSDDYFCDEVSIIHPADLQVDTVPRRRLQALQAAHAMCLCQVYEGDEASKRRARHHRFNSVVAMARSFGFAKGKHENLWEMGQALNWTDFVAREEMIRTLIYVFMLDSGFVIFYNLPPRLITQEALTSLVCPEACFQAPTAEECFRTIQTWTSHVSYRPNISLWSAVKILSRDRIEQHIQDFFLEIGSVNLLILAAVFNSMAFHFRPTLGQASDFMPLKNAITHWAGAWSARPAMGERSAFGTPSREVVSFNERKEMWKRVGFMKHAHEFWMLSRIIIDRMASLQVCSLDSDEMVCGSDGLASTYALVDYDQASMDQLRTTILSAIQPDSYRTNKASQRTSCDYNQFD